MAWPLMLWTAPYFRSPSCKYLFNPTIAINLYHVDFMYLFSEVVGYLAILRLLASATETPVYIVQLVPFIYVIYMSNVWS